MNFGFRIGFNRASAIQPSKRNMRSVVDHAAIVSEYIQQELERGFVLGPFDPQAFGSLAIQTSSIGVIPKKHTHGKWRLIVDLSSPDRRSVNDGIDPALCSLKYTRVEQVAEKVFELGPGAQLAKIDVKSAYRIVPVHPDDRPLLGMLWQDRLYIDASLPFGLRSAPKLFNAITDAWEWIARHLGVEFLWHYLDDFITIGRPESEECHLHLQALCEVCRRLGVSLASEKVEGPSTCLSFLGIVIDSIALELRLPDDKLRRIRSLLTEWGSRRRCTKQELQSLAGQLQHAASIVRPGRSFIRRLFDLLSTVSKQHHHLRLSQGIRSDLTWWSTFMDQWNGVSFMSLFSPAPPTIVIETDASGSWGAGAVWASRWFQLAWTNEGEKHSNIATLELIPIVIASAVWGKHWQRQSVLCRCDNQAVVCAVTARSCRDPNLMHLLRCLFFFESHFQFVTHIEHIPGKDNSLADDLSRDNVALFMQHSEVQPESTPTPIPPPLRERLLKKTPDWNSPSWRQLFKNILKLV